MDRAAVDLEDAVVIADMDGLRRILLAGVERIVIGIDRQVAVLHEDLHGLNALIGIRHKQLAALDVLAVQMAFLRGTVSGDQYKHLLEELPFMATENIMMYCVKKGGDRQALHEAIREHSVDTAKQIKLHGGDNDLLDRIAADARFGLTRDEVDTIIEEGGFTGMAEAQTEAFLQNYVRPLLDKYQNIDRVQVEINI